MKKVLWGVVVVVLLGALALGGWMWWQQSVSSQAGDSGEVLRIARYYWPGQFWVDVAEAKGWFKEAGLNVELVDTNPDFYKSLQDVVDGHLDAQDFYLFDLMQRTVDGADLVMVINNDQSNGAEAILTKAGLTKAADLKGKKIAVPLKSNLSYILHVYLQRNKIAPSEVTLVDMPAEKTIEALGAGTVDAVVSYEPYVTTAITKYGAHKLFNTSELPGISRAGYTFRRSMIEDRPQDIQAFVAVWHRATEFIKQSPQEAFAIVAKNNNTTVGDVQAFTQQAKILDLRDNLTSFTYAAGFESLHGAAREINNYFIAEKITDKQLDSTKFLDAQFIRKLQP